jgi:5'-methylthioadenosine/S-adenosylhomocysteine nucleosidase
MKRAFAAMLLLACSSLLCAGEAPAAPSHYTPSNVVLVLGAVPQEIVPFRDALGQPAAEKLWGIPYYRGRMSGREVVVAITGIGKTFTAMTATLFISHFRPSVVVMSGTGARINQQLRTGDVIVAAELHEHDYGSLTREGMVYRPFNGPDDGREVENRFMPPATLLARADQAIAEYPSPEVTANGATYRTRVRRGVVSSSDLFGVTSQRIAELRDHFHTDIMEMESGPLGLVCGELGVPYLVVRSGSNIAQEAPNDDYLRLGPIAAREAARFTLHLLKYLP